MKIQVSYILLIAFCFGAMSCKKDNYEEPKSALSGKFHYRGEPLQLQYDQVPFEVYQYGFGKVGPINGTITPEGTYSHVLFDGDYKLVVRAGQGPFFWPQTSGKADSISISIKGNTVRDIEVEPYYMVRTPQFSYASNSVTATFKIEKIITDTRARNIDRVFLWVNKTQFVSGNDNLRATEIAGSAITDLNNMSMNVTIPTISPAQNYVFVRVGVRIAGIEDLIFSPVQKITF